MEALEPTSAQGRGLNHKFKYAVDHSAGDCPRPGLRESEPRVGVIQGNDNLLEIFLNFRDSVGHRTLMAGRK